MRIVYQFHRIRCSEPGAHNPYSNVCDLYAMDLDGSNRVLLCEDVYFQQEIMFSQDGKRTAFEGPRTPKNEQTFGSINVDGTDKRSITFWEYLAYGKRSHDGQYIAHNTFQNVYILRADTGKLHVKIPQPNCQNVCWLADGRLGFCTWVDRTAKKLRRAYYTVTPDDPTMRRLSPPGMHLGPCYASPDGRHIILEKEMMTGLYVMSCDGRKVWELSGDRTASGKALWSPDGTRLAVGLMADQKLGIDIIDLRNGSRMRLCGYDYFAEDWTPDSTAVLVMWNRWKEDEKYKTSLCDLELYLADGSDLTVVTKDGRSGDAAFVPIQVPRPSPVEFDFAWARLVYDKSIAEAERAKRDPHTVVRWAMLDAHPASKPPFTVRVGTQSTPAAPQQGIGEFRIEGCAHFPDAFAKIEAAIDERNLAKAEDFTLIYPRYAVPAELENTMHYLAGLVLEETQRRDYRFAREIPAP